MIADVEPPDGKPDEWKCSLKYKHGLPAKLPEQPPGDRRRPHNRERLAEAPIGVGAGAFSPGKPVRQQDESGRINAAFSHAKKKTHDAKLRPRLRQPATHCANSPRDKKNTDQSLCAPMTGEMPAGNLKKHIADEKNTRD